MNKVREWYGGTTNRMVHEEQWIARSPFWPRDTVRRDCAIGTEASHVTKEVGQQKTQDRTEVLKS